MDYSAFYPDVIMDCPGVPVPLVNRAVRESVRTFCKESTAYRKKLASTDMTYSSVTGLYTITIPAGLQIETVISPMVFNGSYTVYTFSDGSQSTSATPPTGTTLVSSSNYSIDSTNVQGASPEWLDINYPGWRTAQSSIDVGYFSMLPTNTFKLAPDNGVDRRLNLTVSLVLMPDRTSLPTLDDEFCNRWFDSIVAGAKFLLMVQPDSEWSNPALAAYFKTKFDDGMLEARSYIRTGLRHPKADGVRHVRLYYK